MKLLFVFSFLLIVSVSFIDFSDELVSPVRKVACNSFIKQRNWFSAASIHISCCSMLQFADLCLCFGSEAALLVECRKREGGGNQREEGNGDNVTKTRSKTGWAAVNGRSLMRAAGRKNWGQFFWFPPPYITLDKKNVFPNLANVKRCDAVVEKGAKTSSEFDPFLYIYFFFRFFFSLELQQNGEMEICGALLRLPVHWSWHTELFF